MGEIRLSWTFSLRPPLLATPRRHRQLSRMAHTNPTTVQVGGLPATVYGLSSLSPSSSPHGLTVLFWLHGRLGSAALVHEKREIEPILAYATEREGRDLLVVTIDQRNHGERLVDLRRNKAWAPHWGEGLEEAELENASHAVDMYSIQSESCLVLASEEDELMDCQLGRRETSRSLSTSSPPYCFRTTTVS